MGTLCDRLMVLPLSWLVGACEQQLSLLTKEWPNGIPLTEAAAARAIELNLDVD